MLVDSCATPSTRPPAMPARTVPRAQPRAPARRRAATPSAPCAPTSPSTAPGAASTASPRCPRARRPSPRSSTRWPSGARRRPKTIPSRLSTRTQRLRARGPRCIAASRALFAGSKAAPSTTLSCPVSRPRHTFSTSAPSSNRSPVYVAPALPTRRRHACSPASATRVLDHRHVGPEELGPLRMPRVLPGQQVPPRGLQVRLGLPAKGMRRRLAHRRPGALAPIRHIVRVLSQPPPGALRIATQRSRRHPRLRIPPRHPE